MKNSFRKASDAQLPGRVHGNLPAIAKRIIVWLLSLATAFCACPSYAHADDGFLIGEWASSDGSATLVFRNDGTYTCNLGFFPETGTWAIQSSDGETMTIKMDGSIILSLMSLAYGAIDGDYHFEVLKCNQDNFYLVQVYGDYDAYSSPCKLAFTREGSSADFTVTPQQEEPADHNDVQTETVTYDPQTRIDLNWGWDLFDRDSSEYSHDIAMAGLVLSQAAEKSQTNVEDKLTKLGFEQVMSIYYGGNADNVEMPATAFGAQRIEMNGEDKVIAAIVVRGTSDWGDILTDIRSVFAGFYDSADNVREEFKSYHASLSERFGMDVTADNTILFITGHSFGGAVAGQLGQMLEGTYAHRNAIFDYTFASPNYQTFEYDRSSFINIHNIINEKDVVPNVPVGYKRYGHDWYYDSSEDKYQEYFDEVYETSGWKAESVGNKHDLRTYLAMMLCDVPKSMGDGAVNPYSLTSIHCPVDIEVYDAVGTFMGKTSGREGTYSESCKTLIMIDGEEKYVLSPPGQSYYVKITGTGEGYMTVIQQGIDTYTGEVVGEKTYENIDVAMGQQFGLSVSDDALMSSVVLSDGDQTIQETTVFQNDIGGKSGIPWKTILVVAGIVAALALVVVVHRAIGKKRNRANRYQQNDMVGR